MNKNIYLIILLLVVIACNKSLKPEQFEGIWMSDRQNYYYIPDTTSENTTLSQGSPFIIDFIDNKNAIVKFFGYKTFNFNWTIKKDSILKIDNHKYKIKYIDQDTIILNLKKQYEQYDYYLYKVKDVKFDIDSIDIANYLTSVIWNKSNIDPCTIKNLNFQDYIEYLDNNGKFLKYWMPKSYESKDSFLNYQLDKWAIGEYKNHFFISEHMRMAGYPTYWNISQLIEINDSILETYNPNYFENEIRKYYGFSSITNIQQKRNYLIGLWNSKNSTDNYYGEYIPERSIKNGRIEKFNDYLFYEFDSIYLYQYGNRTDTVKSEWMLNKDGSAIIYIFHDELAGRNFKGLTISEITGLSQNKLSMNLFNNNMLPGLTEKPREYILNINQEFKKIKKQNSQQINKLH